MQTQNQFTMLILISWPFLTTINERNWLSTKHKLSSNESGTSFIGLFHSNNSKDTGF